MEQQRLQILMNKVLEGRASEQEKKELDDWYASFDQQAANLTEQIEPGERLGLQQKMLASITASLDESAPASANTSPAGKPAAFRQRRRVWIAAAAVLLCLLGAFAWFRYTGSSRNTPPALAWQQESSGQEKRRLLLPDGSAVWLNTGSILRYQPAAFDHAREIWLQGEAYFEVKPNPSPGFTVHAGNLVTQVLGTSFHVNTRHGQHQVAVTVASGKVAVSDAAHRLVLLANQQAVYDAGQGGITRHTVNATELITWTGSPHIFQGQSFGEVAALLEQQFGIPVRFENKAIAACRITASFDAHVSLAEMLDMLARINGNTLRQDAGTGAFFIGGKANCR
jgi:ferric-dicitrate binding protein FerR (iron transport regulator)